MAILTLPGWLPATAGAHLQQITVHHFRRFHLKMHSLFLCVFRSAVEQVGCEIITKTNFLQTVRLRFCFWLDFWTPNIGNCYPKDDGETLRGLTSGQSSGRDRWDCDDDDDDDGERSVITSLAVSYGGVTQFNNRLWSWQFARKRKKGQLSDWSLVPVFVYMEMLDANRTAPLFHR